MWVCANSALSHTVQYKTLQRLCVVTTMLTSALSGNTRETGTLKQFHLRGGEQTHDTKLCVKSITE